MALIFQLRGELFFISQNDRAQRPAIRNHPHRVELGYVNCFCYHSLPIFLRAHWKVFADDSTE